MAAPEEDVPLPADETAETASTEEEQPPISLLQLPGTLLARILGCLPAAPDVAAFGAACSAARAIVAGQAWESVQTLGLHAWSPRAEGSLRWAAERYPKLRALDLEGAPLWRPGQLASLTALSGLARISLRGAWRFRVRGRGRGGARLAPVGLPGRGLLDRARTPWRSLTLTAHFTPSCRTATRWPPCCAASGGAWRRWTSAAPRCPRTAPSLAACCRSATPRWRS